MLEIPLWFTCLLATFIAGGTVLFVVPAARFTAGGRSRSRPRTAPAGWHDQAVGPAVIRYRDYMGD